jgi:hypothetical protein
VAYGRGERRGPRAEEVVEADSFLHIGEASCWRHLVFARGPHVRGSVKCTCWEGDY